MKLKVVSPIFGFESVKEVNLKKVDDFFYELDCGGIIFTLINPLKIRKYEFKLLDSYKKLLKVDSLGETKLFNIVTIHTPIEKSTINFLAPIIINEKNKLLTQIALDDKKYDFALREPIEKFL